MQLKGGFTIARRSLLIQLNRVFCSALALLLFLVAGRVTAQTAKDLSPHSEATLVAEHLAIRPGTPFTVALRLRMEPHWHSYWRNPGDSGLPTTIKWKLPAGFKASEIQWPSPQRIDTPPLVSYAYENEVWLLSTITPPATLPIGKNITLKAQAEWLICKEECLPASANLTLSLPVNNATPAVDSRWSAAFARTRAAFPSLPQGWTVAAERAPKGIVLRVQPPTASDISTDGAHFFASDNSVIAHAAPQKMMRNGDGFQISLELSEYATEAPKRLRGVLVAPKGRAWNASGVRALAVDVPVGARGTAAPVKSKTTTSPPSATATPPTLLLSLGLAFLGGLMLNLMPCVFPVLSLKILGFVQQSGDDKSRVRKHGFAFGIGVLLSFWVLASALLLVRAGGGGAGWGFQLQSPIFVAALSLLLFGVGLNLLGAFEVGLSLTGLGAKAPSRGHFGYGGSFWSGVLATVVATPCTAPFMGAALGFALAQPPLPALLVFTFLGVGMAMPYIVLSMNPAWLKKLPRPGAWMETFKQVMAFPIFATVLWLAWVFGLQTGVDGVALLLGAMLLFGAAVWLWSRWSTVEIDRTRRALVSSGSLLLLSLALFSAWKGAATPLPATESSSSASGKTVWQPFSMAKVGELTAAGTPVFVDFTAAWCITCQVNKRVTLAQPEVMQAFAQHNVTLMRADWTRRDAEITRALESHGRSGVPTYVLYGAKEAMPKVLPEVLSQTIIFDALKELPPRLAEQPEQR
jgi:thiol:disulfide interchange protein DsbD